MSDAQYEQQILSACANARENYAGLAPFIGEEDFTDQGIILYRLIQDYYANDLSAECVDPELLKARVEREYKRHAKHFTAIIDDFEDVSFPNLKAEVIKFKKHTLSVRLANALLNGVDQDIEKYIGAYQTLVHGELISSDSGDTELFFQTDLAEYIEQHSEKVARIKLHPTALNEATGGGALPGHHIVIFAKPECGKTMFAVNMACGMLRCGHRVMYYTNEEPAYNMLVRFLSRMSNKSMDWVQKNITLAQSKAESKGYENLLIKGASPGTPDEICGLIEKYEPDVVFIDQTRLLSIKGQEVGSVGHIETASNAMRAIGKRYGVVMVSLTQAGETAGLILEQQDVYMSNTGVPGSADLLIGLGLNRSFEEYNKRMVSLPKNKLSGLHTNFSVAIDPSKNKVSSDI